MKLAAARVFVHDLETASDFYESALGLRVAARGPEADFVVFEAQTCDLVVERVAAEAPQDEQILVGRFTGLSFNVKNIDQLCQALAAKGVQFTGQPEKQAWGGTLATLCDPAGNQLQLVEYPSAA
jgi:catechol 2,3-dioxygenase-like lactoylglutathione lyase family enzyme